LLRLPTGRAAAGRDVAGVARRHGHRQSLQAVFLPDPVYVARLVAEAASGAEAIQLAAAHRPDVALLDIQMPEVNGIEAARQIVAANPDARVLMLTMFDDDH
jgi:DNA-binding NarL/FixJ family response regulator